MGCLNSRLQGRLSSKKTRGAGSKRYLPQSEPGSAAPSSQAVRGLPESRPDFTPRQRQLVCDTWKIVQEDISRVGVVMFMKLFETHPDVQDVFVYFRGKSQDDLKQSAQLKSHALRVMSTVEKCIARINEPSKMEDMLHDLGARHVIYNAKVDYIDLIGPQFIWAIEPVLGDKWTPEVEEAWSDLFKLVSHLMKEKMVF